MVIEPRNVLLSVSCRFCFPVRSSPRPCPSLPPLDAHVRPSVLPSYRPPSQPSCSSTRLLFCPSIHLSVCLSASLYTHRRGRAMRPSRRHLRHEVDTRNENDTDTRLWTTRGRHVRACVRAYEATLEDGRGGAVMILPPRAAAARAHGTHRRREEREKRTKTAIQCGDRDGHVGR
ncbi:uncharacterized protein BKA78DRAFT_64430 [Phyllosticta capitalensis]|uniref:uncharacterized protein n=1 Tax=Phyllosticta capitalensis TaxID=121624 RepID=UPI0031311695